METYITLIYLTIAAVVFCGWLIKKYYQHEKKFLNTFEKPLDNKSKWWYN